MKKKSFKLVVILILIMVGSCEEPETLVTNIIHADGSIARRIEMRDKKNNFKLSAIQVPVDSTWTIKDSLVIGKKNDTIWIKTAEKKFRSVDEINKDYLSEKGSNRELHRNASFSSRFRWFNTVFRFSEKIDKSLLYGYPLKDFLAKEEIEYYFLPESISSEKLAGPDSTKYKSLNDSIEKKTERCTWSSLVSEWIEEFTKLTAGKAGMELSRTSLKAREKEVVDTIMRKLSESDSSLVSHFLGDSNYKKFKPEEDTSSAIVERRFNGNLNFSKYSVKFIMPGKVTGTNGFINKNGELLWPVKSDFFLTQPYEMWAESKIPNYWAWIVSGLFLIFVVTGVIIRLIKKG